MEITEIFFGIVLFVFGSILGSFLNVVALRHKTGVSAWFSRSFCFSCGLQLSWQDLFPILSFLALGGKCRNCKTRLSPRYLFVEVLMGALVYVLGAKILGLHFLETVAAAQLLWFGYALSIFSLLLVISLYDIQHKIIPDIFSLLFGIVSFSTYFLRGDYSWNALGEHIAAAVILFIPFFLLWYVSKGRLIGLGDGKLAIGIGFLLGLQWGTYAVIFAFWFGALFALGAMVLQRIGKITGWFNKRGSRWTLGAEVPFGPFLALATFAVYCWNWSPLVVSEFLLRTLGLF